MRPLWTFELSCIGLWLEHAFLAETFALQPLAYISWQRVGCFVPTRCLFVSMRCSAMAGTLSFCGSQPFGLTAGCMIASYLAMAVALGDPVSTHDFRNLSRAIIVAGVSIGLGIATPSIIAALTRHERFVAFDREKKTVLDTRTGEICHPGPRAVSSAQGDLWRELGRKCDRIEISD